MALRRILMVAILSAGTISLAGCNTWRCWQGR